MFGELLLTAGVVLIAYAFYVLSTKSARYFEERNLKYGGFWHGLKTFYGLLFGKIDVFSFSQRVYNQFPDEPYVLYFLRMMI